MFSYYIRINCNLEVEALQDHWSLCRKIWIFDWLIEATPPGRHVTTPNNHSTNAVFRLFVYIFLSWYWWPICQKLNSCMCSCEMHRMSVQRMGTNISPINMIVIGHELMCLSQSLQAICCSPTRPHRGWSGCAAVSFVCTACMGQWDIQIRST